MKNKNILILISAFLISTGCTTQPIGPSVSVVPDSTKSFDSFQKDDKECRLYAQEEYGKKNNDTILNTGKAVLFGTTLGAIAGALHDGGHSKNMGTGAAIGMISGAAIGSIQGNDASSTIQHLYDTSYQQCMYIKGYKIIGYSSN